MGVQNAPKRGATLDPWSANPREGLELHTETSREALGKALANPRTIG